MGTGKDGIRQVIKGAIALSAKVSLAMGMSFIESIFDDFRSVAVGTFDWSCPPKLTYHFVTFCVIDQSLNVNSHLPILENSDCLSCPDCLTSKRIHNSCEKGKNNTMAGKSLEKYRERLQNFKGTCDEK